MCTLFSPDILQAGAVKGVNVMKCPTDWIISPGAGTAQWLERRTRDRKVAGSNPCRSGGSILFSRVNFLCWLLLMYSFHPRVTAEARKRSWSFCKMCRWQVTAKYAWALRMWLCMKWHGVQFMVYTELAPRRQQFHVAPAMPALFPVHHFDAYLKKKKMRYKKLFTHVESHASAVSLLERAENSAI